VVINSSFVSDFIPILGVSGHMPVSYIIGALVCALIPPCEKAMGMLSA